MAKTSMKTYLLRSIGCNVVLLTAIWAGHHLCVMFSCARHFQHSLWGRGIYSSILYIDWTLDIIVMYNNSFWLVYCCVMITWDQHSQGALRYKSMSVSVQFYHGSDVHIFHLRRTKSRITTASYQQRSTWNRNTKYNRTLNIITIYSFGYTLV